MGDDVERVFKHSEAHFQTATLLHLHEERMSQPKEYRSNASGNRAPSCLVHVLGREKGTLGSDELEGSFTV